METKKVLGIIFSLLFVGAFAFVLSWGIINFNKIKDGMSGTGVYTKEDINKSYEDGYNTALTDKEEYTKLIASYRDTITTLNDNISQLNSQVTILQNNNKDYSNQIDKLNTQKTSLETQVNNLTTIKTNNETTIASLNSQIASLRNQVTNLTNSGEDKSEQIKTLNSQITTLQNTVSQLQTINNMNVDTITSLNTQITNLNTQISDMTLQSQNSQSQINALNNKISELQTSVTYYESYIAQLENGEQVVATFEFDGSVYNIQIVNKGSKLSVTTPTSTDYKIFNVWTVNGSAIDLSTYTITTNTKIVADVTYKYDVKFKVDNTIYNSQIVTKNCYATIPTNPTKTGYEFDGWSLNGVDVISDITTRQVTQNVTYIAVFTKVHNVTFINGDNVISTQMIRNGEYAETPSKPFKPGYLFNGWTINSLPVELTSYKIFNDVVINSNFSQLTWKETDTGIYTPGPVVTFNSKQYSIIDGNVHVFDKDNKQWNLIITNPDTTLTSVSLWTDNTHLFISYNNSNGLKPHNYFIDTEKNQLIETPFFSKSVIFIYNTIINIDGIIYLNSSNPLDSSHSTEVFNSETMQFEESEITLPVGEYFTFKGITYVFYQNILYKYNKNTNALEDIGFTKRFTSVSGFWTDGDTLYFSAPGYSDDVNVCLNEITNTWVEITWDTASQIRGMDVWSDGENVYVSCKNPYTNTTYAYVLSVKN